MDILRAKILFLTLGIVWWTNCAKCLYVECEKDENITVYIKNFRGSGNLYENFGFCSNKKALVLIFKNCKVEQYVIRREDLHDYYPKVKTIVWQCQGKCLIEENDQIVNYDRCQKGKRLLYEQNIFNK